MSLDDLITAPSLQVQGGLDLLDSSGNFLEDISGDLVNGEIECQAKNDVRWTFRADIRRELDWVNDRLMPWKLLTVGATSQKCYYGVYIPLRPQTNLGQEPATYSVMAKEVLSLLVDPIGSSYVVAAGTGYLAALRTILAARIPGAVCLFDSTAEASVAAAPMVWALDTSEPRTWLGGPVRGLTQAVGYNALWADAAGNFRTEPTTDPHTRTPRRTLDVSPGGNCIVLPERTLTTEYGLDSAAGYNYWRAVRRGMTTLPTEGVGQYTVDQSGSGIPHKRVWQSEAADQTTLETEVNQTVLDDTQRVRTIDLSTRPQPDIQHLDTFIYTGDHRVGTVLAQLRSCTIPLRPAIGDGRLRMTIEVLV